MSIVSACSPPAPVIPAGTPTPAADFIPKHAPEIRIGLIDGLNDLNVWALFSGQEYAYNDYAVRSHYWPRLYELSIPDQEFEPRLAAGMPTPVLQEGVFHVATVPVRTDLLWSDGSAFTAHDVAFTVNATLEFELGFDWGDFYDRHALDHAEAVSADTLKVYFRSPPDVSVWQLGVLQGPVVQAEYWGTRVASAAESLPTAEARDRILTLQDKAATLQTEVNRLYELSLTAQGEEAREVQATLRRQQGNLDEATNDLAADQSAVQDALKAARASLFGQSDAGEPLLGPWLPAEGGETASSVTNLANPDYPGRVANFDRAVYVLFDSPEAAGSALTAGEVNLVLDPSEDAGPAAKVALVSSSRNLRVLMLNPSAPGLDDPALRSALACVLDQEELAHELEAVVPLPGLIQAQEPAWRNPEATPPCAGSDRSARLTHAVELLRSRGYSWESEPLNGQPGRGLKRPDGSPVPVLRLVASNTDARRATAAAYFEARAAELGVEFNTQIVVPDAIDYAVLSSGDFDAAVLGWTAASYPGYICDWFGAGGIFDYRSARMTSACGELQASSSLEDARAHIYDVQAVLIEEAPLIPLYAVAATDGLHGIAYPFSSVMDGLLGVYGVPGLAYSTEP